MALCCLLPTGWTLAAASDYRLRRWTVDGGGSISQSAGSYTLHSTIGQPDASSWGGGEYSISGGFWNSGTNQRQVYLPLVIRE